MNTGLKYISPVSLLPEYKLDRPIVFLSETVVTEAVKNQFVDSSIEILPEIWKDQNLLNEKRNYLDKVYKNLQEKIASTLNQIHGVSYPLTFWEIPMALWLQIYLHTLFDRYYRLKIAVEKYGIANLNLLVCKCDVDFTADNDYKDYYIKFALTEQTVSAFYGHVAKEIGIPVLEFISNKPIERTKWVARKRIRPFSWFFYVRVFNKLKNELLFSIPLKILEGKNILMDYYILNKGDKFYFTKKSEASFFNKNKKINKVIRQIDRNKLLTITTDDDFQKIAISLLPKFMPRHLLEEFESYKQYSQRWCNFKIYISDAAWYHNILFCYAAALGKLKGAKIIGVQHGGGYGHDNVYTEYIERKLSDFFVTWGWKDSAYNGAQLVPLPSPQLSKNSNLHRERFLIALYGGTEISKHFHRLQPYTSMPHYILKYFTDSKRFVAKLTSEVRKCLVYRPHPADMGWFNERKSLFKDFPEVRVEYYEVLSDLLKWIKLYICDHPATSFLEALTINTPTVLFWEYNSDNERETAVPYFDLLRKAGILFHDPVKAANHVNNIWNDVQGWWQQPEVQKAKDEFCHQFARTSKNWRKEWVEFLKGLT